VYTLTLRTDSDGTVQAYFKQPATPYVQSQINVSAGTSQTALTTRSTVVGDTDGNRLSDAWEVQYFGHTGVDPNADPDSDSLTNLQEYTLGTNPLAANPDQDPDGDGRTNTQELAAGSNPFDFYNGRAFALATSPSVISNYDASGRISAVTYANGSTVQFTFDAAGNLTSVTTSSSGGGAILAWRTAHGLPADGSGNGADTAIVSNDGLPNLAKYAFGLDPHIAITTDQPVISLTQVSGSGYLTLTYQRPAPAPTDLVYTVQVSVDGTTWTSGPGATVNLGSTTTNGLTTVVVRDATAVGSPSFGRRIRLSITRTSQ
jgi:YD repeat-containing protein